MLAVTVVVVVKVAVVVVVVVRVGCEGRRKNDHCKMKRWALIDLT
jgi:hypothetical protein